jgi:diguanylate cyclase (GGDEF)-like protein/PAS domain S-box-containing protein
VAATPHRHREGFTLPTLSAQRRNTVAANLWLAVACVAAGSVGQFLAARPGEPPPLALAAGIGLAALYSRGWRLLPGLLLGSLLPALLPPLAPPLPGAAGAAGLLLASAAVLQAMLGAALLRRWLDPAIASGRAVLTFLLLTPLICCVRASLSVLVLAAFGGAGADLAANGPSLWLTLWIGDAIGVLLAAPLCWVVIGRPRALWRPRRALLALPLVVSAVAFMAIYRQALVWEHEEQMQTFSLKAQEVGQMMQAALSEHERFIAGVARAVDDPGAAGGRRAGSSITAISPENFYDIARPYLHDRPELLAMAWLPRVTDAARAAFETWASAYYGRRFELLDLTRSGAPQRAAHRPDYFPILLIEPASGELLLGRDFMTESGRGHAISEALRTGRPAASAPVRLHQTGTLGIHLMQQVQGSVAGGPPAGMLDLALRVDTYLGRAVAQAGFAHFLVRYTDITDGAAPLTLVDGIGPAAARPQYQQQQQYRKQLAFGGRRYELRLTPDAAYLHARTSWQSWSVLTGGLLLTALLGALMLVISGERTRIQAQVDNATALLREREARLQAILDNAADAIVTVDQNGAVQSANAAAGALFGYPPETLCGLRLERLLDMTGAGAGSAETLARLAQATQLAQNGAGARELTGITSAGARFPLSLSASQVKLGEERIFVCIIHDLTEQRRAQQHIYQLAHHDPLTGLENRFALNLHLEQLLAQARRAGQAVALLFLDLDHFKKINDSHGHQTGDRLLVEVAQRLRELLRDADIIARLGGDEFIVVMAGTLTPELVGAVAVRIVQSLSAPYHCDGKTMHSGSSVGIAMFPADAANAGMLVRHADTAMYVAKSEGRGNFQFYSPAMNAATHERLMMENRIWHGLGEQQFDLYLQPQVALDSGRVVGAEALLRWPHPELGMIEPDRVIPIAEESGQIIALGDWVLARAIELMVQWQRDRMGGLRMAVNLSARQCHGRELLPRLDALLAEAGVAPALLELEITESVAMHDPEHTRLLLRQLRERGINVAIDDFGTGYSSLSYLKLFAIDRIKIDRGFVTDIETDPNDAAIVTATIGLAHAMGLKVLAEGVETAAQRNFLRLNGCDEAQGFFFAKPMPAAQFYEFMARARGQTPIVQLGV